MLKFRFSGAIFILIQVSCSSDKIKNDLFKIGLNERVRSYTESKFSVSIESEKPYKNKLIGKDYYKYNLQGKVIDREYHYSDGSLTSKHLFKYDTKGNLVEKMEQLGIPAQGDTYNYDNNGNMVESFCINLNSEVRCGKSVYKYDTDGNMISRYNYGSDNRLFSKSIYNYDNDGRIIEENNLSTDDRVFYSIKNKYDNDGNLMETTFKNGSDESNASIKHTERFTYDSFDENENWIKKLTYKENIPVEITERDIEYY